MFDHLESPVLKAIFTSGDTSTESVNYAFGVTRKAIADYDMHNPDLDYKVIDARIAYYNQATDARLKDDNVQAMDKLKQVWLV